MDHRTQDLLVFLDRRLNDLMCSLHKNRQALMAIQTRMAINPAYVGPLGEALTALHDAERTLADVQQRLALLTPKWHDD